MKLETKVNWAIGLSITSIALTIVMFAMWCCNAGGLSAVSLDTFVGVIVALLAIIVTLVLGWQIFNIFELKNKIDEVNELKRQFEQQRSDIQQLTLKNKHITGFTWGKSAIRDNDWLNAFRFLVISLSSSLQMDSPINVESILILLESIPHGLKHKLKYKRKNYDEIVDADKEIRSLRNFSLIEERYKSLYDNIFAKIEIDDSQK